MAVGDANPVLGTVVADTWWYRRRAPKGRILHWIDPASLAALCNIDPPLWEWAPEDKELPVCKKCRAYASRLSLDYSRRVSQGEF